MTNESPCGTWDIPPPPGTEDDQASSGHSRVNLDTSRAIDSIDPYLKNPQYVEYEKKHVRHRRRSRSNSSDKLERRQHSGHKSKSHRRSRSKSKFHHKRRHHSRSRSRSRSRGRYGRRDRHGRHSSRSKHSSRSRHSSRGDSKRSSQSRRLSCSKSSRSRSRSRSRSYRPSRSSNYRQDYREKSVEDSSVNDPKDEMEDSEQLVQDNAFKNDGSFLEMFKKLQEEKKAQEETQSSETEKQKLFPSVGKRRGGRVLKTGIVLKTKAEDNEESAHDPWSVYMKEVKRYKEACCDDDSKTRPLVK